MPPLVRRLLLGFAFVALALILAPATASTTGGLRASVAQPLATTNHPEGRAPTAAPRHVTVPERAATLAVRMVGTPYRWGGAAPGGFDCSGLIRWAYGRFGVDLPHNSNALYGVGRVVPRTQLETGDLLFFTGLGHVGLYLGGGRMVQAPYSGKTVEIVDLTTSHYGDRLIGARRVITGG
jgi:cell wall-associated NlpC family hydrolase